MADLTCKRRGGPSCVKNGLMAGKQRYLCKARGYNFTRTPPRGKPAGVKALAVLLYGWAGVPTAKVAELAGASEVAASKWAKAAGRAARRSATDEAEIVTLDEAWRYVNGEKQGLALEGL